MESFKNLITFQIDNYNIQIIIVPFDDLIKKQINFNGQKLFHPFNLVEIQENYSFAKKNKVTQRIVKKLVYENKYVSDNVKNDIENALEFHLKHDGECGLIFYNEQENKYYPYTRFDIKKNQNTNDFNDSPKNWISCEPKPIDNKATHWPHFRPCYEDTKCYKWKIEAFNKMISSKILENKQKSFTCEYMGRKCNYCQSDPIEENSVIVPHGSIIFNIPIELRNYNGFRKIFESIPIIEGFVVYCQNGKIYKIRRDMYLGSDNKRLEWPTKNPKLYNLGIDFKNFNGLSDIVALR